jgi:hypothetical protein
MPPSGCSRCSPRAVALLLAAAALTACVAPARGAYIFACAATDDPVVCAALGALYGGTHGVGWYGTSGWDVAASGKPVAMCSLSGISCNAAGDVTAMCACTHTRCRAALRAAGPRACASHAGVHAVRGCLLPPRCVCC